MIVVWSSATCGPCHALRGALRRAGVVYVERDVSELSDAQRASWRAKGWSTPVVEHAGGTFSGFDPAKVQTLIDMRR